MIRMLSSWFKYTFYNGWKIWADLGDLPDFSIFPKLVRELKFIEESNLKLYKNYRLPANSLQII